MSRWHITVDGRCTQGDKTLHQAASVLAGAYAQRAHVEALVRGPQDTAFRTPTHDEAAMLVQAATKEVQQ